MARFYSGATVPGTYGSMSGRDWEINAYTIVLGQIDNNVYISTNFTGTAPIGKRQDNIWNPYSYEKVEDKNSILDYLPESWLLYAMNVGGLDCTKHVYRYNHNDLVADGIEQS